MGPENSLFPQKEQKNHIVKKTRQNRYQTDGNHQILDMSTPAQRRKTLGNYC